MKTSIIKALLYKDYLLMKAQGKSVIFITVLIIGINMIGKNYSMLPMFVSILPITVVLSTIGGDDIAKFYRYAFSTPVGKKELVKSKYITLMFVSLLSVIITYGLINIVAKSQASNMMFVFGVSTIGSLITTALMVPLVYKFGITQGRYILMVMLFMIFSGGGFLIQNMGTEDLLQEINVKMIMVLAFAISLLVLWLSYKVSIKILEKKEY